MNISIDEDEVLRYLGHKDQEIDENINNLIDESIEEMQNIIMPKTIYREFQIERIQDKLHLTGSELNLQGKSIEGHLKDSNKCLLIALTLGYKVDRLISFNEKTNLTKAIILDACATSAIESFANKVSGNLGKKYMKNGQGLTSRFSPGYGDLDISIQSKFLDLLNARRTIGLTATSHSILIPRKSVTAIIGIVNKEKNIRGIICKDCNKYDNCMFNKGDGSCGI